MALWACMRRHLPLDRVLAIVIVLVLIFVLVLVLDVSILYIFLWPCNAVQCSLALHWRRHTRWTRPSSKDAILHTTTAAGSWAVPLCLPHW